VARPAVKISAAASPKMRPAERITAVTSPGMAIGSTTWRIVVHLDAPRARLA
jgi:hypothetical protein